MIAPCAGPATGMFGAFINRSFVNCPTYSCVSGVCAVTCSAPTSSRVAPLTSPTSDTPGMGCDFSCPLLPLSQRNCSIRGGDGLPVELMDFTIEDDNPPSEEEKPDSDTERKTE